MGAVVGVEYIQHFANARAAGETVAGDLECLITSRIGSARVWRRPGIR